MPIVVVVDWIAVTIKCVDSIRVLIWLIEASVISAVARMDGNKVNYPDDYPELGSEITVSGTFELYEEGDIRYCRLVDAEMIGQ